jgi:hypothetical protein
MRFSYPQPFCSHFPQSLVRDQQNYLGEFSWSDGLVDKVKDLKDGSGVSIPAGFFTE